MKLQLVTLFLPIASLSQAAIVVSFGTNPGPLNNINLGTELSATSIDGNVNGYSVLFTSQNGLDLQGGGQAGIRESDRLIDAPILFQIPNATFSIFQVNPQRGKKPKPGATLLISAVGTSTSINDFALPLGAGENRLVVQGLGESLLSVSVGVRGDTYDNYKQPRVGGIEPIVVTPEPLEPAERDTATVPEAPLLSLIGAGLTALAWLRKRITRTN